MFWLLEISVIVVMIALVTGFAVRSSCNGLSSTTSTSLDAANGLTNSSFTANPGNTIVSVFLFKSSLATYFHPHILILLFNLVCFVIFTLSNDALLCSYYSSQTITLHAAVFFQNNFSTNHEQDDPCVVTFIRLTVWIVQWKENDCIKFCMDS